jgi:murein DD-endopeptidase MepM/ murein hydrolase activator NlpD
VALVPLATLACGDDEPRTEPSDVAFESTPAGTSVRSPAVESSATAASGAEATSGPTGGQSTPGPAAPPAPALSIELQPPQVGIGESMVIRAAAPGASSVTVDFRDVAYRMVRQGDGSFWLAVGVPLDAAAGASVLTSAARDSGSETLASAETAYEVVAVERPVDYLEVTAETASVLTPDHAAQESAIRGLQFAEFEALPRWSGLFLRPTEGAITTQFGQGRSINGGPIGAFHTGVDLANDEGTPVRAAAPGVVSWTGAMPIRGNAVIIDHGGGVKTGYHHLSSISVASGQEVTEGETIGLVGMTGLATGPHLHWELTIWGVNVDPITWTARSFGP